MCFVRYFVKYFTIIVLFSAGHQKAVDYHTQLVLYSIGNYIKSILKPRNITSQDKVRPF